MKISVSLPDELAARVDALRRPGVGRSKVIQELLEEALRARDKGYPNPLPAARLNEKAKVLDRMRELDPSAGTARDLLTDDDVDAINRGEKGFVGESEYVSGEEGS